MPFPAEILRRNATVGGETALESGESLILQATVKASRGLIWRTTGWHYQTVEKVYTSDEGAELTIPLVCTDLAGPWGLDDDSGTVLDMSAPGSYSHRYTIKLTVLKSVDGRLSKVGERTYTNVTVPTGDGSPIDLDTLLPVGTQAGGVVLVPDTWSTRLDALEDGGGTGGGVTVDDTPAAPSEGESASYLVTSAVVWPAGLVWSTDPDGGVSPVITGSALVSLFTVDGVTRAIMGATFPGFELDSTSPLAGTLAASAITDTGFTLTVTGASDNTALHAEPYQFSTDNDSSWSAWQASPIFNVIGKTASTGYQARHATRDLRGNRTLGTAITVTTTGPIIKLADLITEDAPSAWWRMDDETGTTMTDSSGNGRHGTYATIMNLGTSSLDPNGLRAVSQAANGANYTDYTAVPAGAWMNGDFTIAALVRLTSTASVTIFGRSRANSSVRWWMEVATGRLHLHNGAVYLPESAPVSTGVTYHVAVSRQGNTYSFHLDGVQISSAANAGTLTDPFDIGTRIGGVNNSLRGAIDEVAWFPTALSTARIRAHAVAAGRP